MNQSNNNKIVLVENCSYDNPKRVCHMKCHTLKENLKNTMFQLGGAVLFAFAQYYRVT